MAAPQNLPPIITPGGNVAPTQQPYPPAVQPYIDNGLTYQSNNADFVERDDNGNIIINQGSEDNQNLVLEAMSLFYVNRSVVRNIDTRFKYFKFPAENISIPDISFEGFGVADLLNSVYAKYRPSEDFEVNATTEYTGILMDTVVEGQPQTYRNRYEITPAIKAEATAGLRMRIRLRHSYTETGIDLGNSRRLSDARTPPLRYVKEEYSNLRSDVQSEISNTDWDNFFGSMLTAFNYYILEGNPPEEAKRLIIADDIGEVVSYYSQQATLQNPNPIPADVSEANTDPETYANDVSDVWNLIRSKQNDNNQGTIYFSILKRTTSGDIIRNFQELTVNAGNSTAFIDANTTKVSEYDIIIPPDLFDVGELFGIGAIVGQRPGIEQPRRFVRTQHTILSAGTQWSITDASKNVDENNVEIETA